MPKGGNNGGEGGDTKGDNTIELLRAHNIYLPGETVVLVIIVVATVSMVISPLPLPFVTVSPAKGTDSEIVRPMEENALLTSHTQTTPTKPLTSRVVKTLRQQRQQAQRHQVSQAGCNGRGHVVRVDMEVMRADDDSDHDGAKDGTGYGGGTHG